MKKEIGSQKLKLKMIERFNKCIDYYGYTEMKNYLKYYNKLKNEKLSNKNKVFVSIIRKKKDNKNNYNSIIDMGFNKNDVIPIIDNYINTKKSEIIIIEFNK